MPGTLWMSRDPWNCVTAGGSYRLVRLQGGKLSGKKSGCLSDAPRPNPSPSQGLEALVSGQSPFNIPELPYR